MINLGKSVSGDRLHTNELQWPTEDELELMTDEEKQQLARDYYRGKYKHLGYKPTFMKWLKYKMGPLFGIAIGAVILLLVYGIINLVLVGGQNIWHAGDKDEMRAIEFRLNQMDKEITNYEFKITAETINDIEYQVYTKTIEAYNDKVKEYNELAEKVGSTYYIVPGFGRR